MSLLHTNGSRSAVRAEPVPAAPGVDVRGVDVALDGPALGARSLAPPVIAPAPSAPAALADPGPLGLAAFALTTFLLSVFNANIIGDKKLELVVLPVALFYGGLAQLLAGMWEFKKANTFGATAFTSYGAFWLSFAGYVKFVAPGLPAATAHQATGLFLLAWTIFTVYMLIAALRVTGALTAVFAVLTVTFALLVAGSLGQDPTLIKAGGICGIVTAGLAWYTSCAGLLKETWKRSVLPTFPAHT